jgi:hypothetical protein
MAHDVFICHSSTDKTVADAACATLESQGIRCWIAPRDIQAGTSYAEGIVHAITEAKVMVLIFSATANASQQVEREIERAVHRNIPLIPFRIEDVAPERGLEYFLSTPHWLDAYTPPLEKHLKTLATQVAALLGQPLTPVTPIVAAAAAAPAVAAAAPPPRRGALPWVPIAAGAVALSVLVLAGAIFLKPSGAPSATNAAANLAISNAAATNAVAETAPATNAAAASNAAPANSAIAATNAPIAPAATPAPTPTQVATAPAPARPACRISAPERILIEMKVSPGGASAGQVHDGAPVRPGQRVDMPPRTWVHVDLPDAGRSGWVLQRFINCSGAVSPGRASAVPVRVSSRAPIPLRVCRGPSCRAPY